MSLETMTKLATYTLGSTSSTITFDNIPQTYTDLKLVVSARGDTTNSDIGITGVQTHYIRINGNLGTLHSSRYIYGDGATATLSNVSGETIWRAPGSTNASDTASTFSNSELYIAGYTRNTYKSAVLSMVTENNATTAGQFISAFVYAGTEPITKIEILTSSGNFVANSTFTLYGVKAMRTAVGNSIKATGGNISFDGTYVYHAFNATDTFIPTTNLIADLLVVGGGGSGGTAGGVTAGGGGGAGGISYQPNTQLISGSSYPVTVGAGGAGGATGYTAGPDGSNSTFSTFTGFGGGGGGAGYTGTQGIANGRSGGSGGGGGSLSTTSTGTGGSATQTTSGTNIGYGNAGGIGRHSAGAYVAAGGGGGSGEAGVGATAASPSIGGRGGDGTTAFSTWKIGQNVSGTYYLAGGGGGCGGGSGGDNPRGGYGGGAAGGNQGSATQATNATINTGGGGGGGPVYTGAGGSGVVVVRYRA